ncbi:uncharacterized protein K452DRAFT_289687 [Aplosporella prunicola CBS 121167]|uniref:Uncharacterized protein n=1 Tax=Aplosporella prunicola CBS 121167 TaxID=1176127 RepID=A0A6A6B9V8_9PEZI|nr:uncharacterized protein K452DRAFT_289687 [Aplosporella prunicola CBS 121167]KAF2139697.1 hypothetical protein K452DRAFT_289687 [Aplosporella prunicola CBS 121167]
MLSETQTSSSTGRPHAPASSYSARTSPRPANNLHKAVDVHVSTTSTTMHANHSTARAPTNSSHTAAAKQPVDAATKWKCCQCGAVNPDTWHTVCSGCAHDGEACFGCTAL